MTVSISGTSGIVNDATDLNYTGTLTGGTGVVNIGSGQVYKDASGNVGIGTSLPAGKLQLGGTNSVLISGEGTGDRSFGTDVFSTLSPPSIALMYQTDGSTYKNYTGLGMDFTNGVLGIVSNYQYTGGGKIAFYTGNKTSSGGTLTERARIDSSGNLLVGTTDSGKGALTVGKAAPNSAYGQICALSPTAGDSNISGMSVVKYANDSTTAQVLIRFLMNQGGTGQGQINANGANTAAFGSYSDSRLKENIVDLPSQLDNIMALRPVEYDYIESMGGGHQIGFVAQEVQAIYPDLVAENEDGMLTLTDMNKNDARLIKCIQEQQTLITALTARITALEGAAA